MNRTKRMFSSLITLLVLLVVGMPVEAQGGGGRGRGGGPGMAAQLPRLLAAAIEHKSEIGLDETTVAALEELQPQVTEAFAPYEERLQAARGSGDRGGMREMMAEIGEAMAPFVESFNALVTEEQRGALREYMPRRRRGGGV